MTVTVPQSERDQAKIVFSLREANRNLDALNDLFINVKTYGATGSGATDDTAYIQAAVTAATSAGKTLWFPPGTYKITSAITIGQTNGWKIVGASRGATTISQATNNTQIFSFTGDLTYSWAISDLNFTWASAQSSSNTHAVAIWFATADANRFNFQIARCTFGNGFRSISNDTSVTALTWGADIRNCTHNDEMTGSFCYLGQNVSSGQPNICIENVNIGATSMAAAEPCIYLNACDNFWINNLEINSCSNGNTLLQTGSSSGAIGCMKVEQGTWGSNTDLMLFENGNVFISNLMLLNLTIGAATNVVGIHAGTSAKVTVGNCLVNFSGAITGSFYLVSTGVETRFINGPSGIIGTTGAFLSNVASTATAHFISVDAWQQQRLSDDNGNADATWTLGTTPNVMQFLVQLTADRVLTLSDASSGADSNLFNGVVVTAVRNASTPGAFKLTIKNADGGTIGVLDSTNGSISFMWQRFSWRVINYTTWTGTAP